MLTYAGEQDDDSEDDVGERRDLLHQQLDYSRYLLLPSSEEVVKLVVNTHTHITPRIVTPNMQAHSL
jgi:hypothetical protein